MDTLIGERLKETRTYLGLAGTWVAQRSGMSVEVLNSIESLDHIPTIAEIARLAQAYCYPVTHFTEEPIGPDPEIALLARADKRLTDADILGVQRFSEFLRACGRSDSTHQSMP